MSSKDADICGFCKVSTNFLPSVGEVVNLHGDPYLVHSIGHAFGDGEHWAYIRVVNAPVGETNDDNI